MPKLSKYFIFSCIVVFIMFGGVQLIYAFGVKANWTFDIDDEKEIHGFEILQVLENGIKQVFINADPASRQARFDINTNTPAEYVVRGYRILDTKNNEIKHGLESKPAKLFITAPKNLKVVFDD